MKKVSGVPASSPTGGMFLFYGGSKLWKTTTALMVPPELRPVAYLDADRGAYLRMKLLMMTPEQREAAGIVERLPEGSGPWVGEGIDFFYPEKESYFADCLEFAIKEAPKYKLVVVDTLSHLGDNILREVVSTQYKNIKKADELRMKMETPGGAATEHAVLSDYGMGQDRVMELFLTLDDAPCHVLLLAHEKTGEIREKGAAVRIQCGPRSVGNALIEKLPSYCDMALRFQPESSGKPGEPPKVVLRSINHGGMYIAGDRSGTVPDQHPLDPKDLWERMQRTIGLGEAKIAAVAAGGKG